MKVYQLLEQDDPYAPVDLTRGGEGVISLKDKKADKQFIELVRGECGDWLKACQAGNNVVYRGMQDTGPESFLIGGRIRPDRRPLQMPQEAHELLHLAYLELGLKATRKNSLFCTCEFPTAKAWGDVFIVFPRDGWSVTAWQSGETGYSFYDHKLLAMRAASMTDDQDEVVKLLAKNLQEEDSAKSLDSTAELTPYLKEEWVDMLVTGGSYIGFRMIPKATTSTTDQAYRFLQIIRALGLEKAKNVSYLLG